jgi:hypothetical protein
MTDGNATAAEPMDVVLRKERRDSSGFMIEKTEKNGAEECARIHGGGNI